jgi:hypothetical protein
MSTSAWVPGPTFLAAWDVPRARVFGRCEVKRGIAPVNRLVGGVMGQEPYKFCSPRLLDHGQLLCSSRAEGRQPLT